MLILSLQFIYERIDEVRTGLLSGRLYRLTAFATSPALAGEANMP